MSNFGDLSSIQLRTILPIMRGDDVIAQVQSGTDKSATLSIAVLRKLDLTNKNCQALIMIPTPELAQQTARAIDTLGNYLNVQCCACVDATDVSGDIAKLQRGVHVVVGTPGRICDLISRRALRMDNIKIFCLDEADNILRRDFKGQTYEGTWEVFQRLPGGTQVILLSGTLSADVMKLVKQFMREPIRTLVELDEPVTESDMNNRDVGIDESNWDQIVDSFDNMGLKVELLRGIDAYGLDCPSVVQYRTIVSIVKGQDVIVQGQDRTGTSAALGIAILQKLDTSVKECQVLMLVPIRELAQEMQKTVIALGDYMDVECHACIGGTNVREEQAKLQTQGVHVVVGTPGRVYDMIKRRALRMDNISLFCLGDAEELMSRGFEDKVYEVFQLLPQDVQVAWTSATMSGDIVEVTKKFMRDPLHIQVKHDELAFEGIKQFYTAIKKESLKLDTLCNFWEAMTTNQVVIFCNTRRKVDLIHQEMNSRGLSVSAMHRGIEQKEHEVLMKEFQSGSSRVLITTDAFSRIIHVQQVPFVINYDLPTSHENYLRRIGRGGRFGCKSVVVNIVTTNEVAMLRKIEQFYHTQINETPLNIADLL